MKTIALALLLAASVWGYGDNVIYWTPHGCDEGRKTASDHGGHGRDESAMFAAMNLEGNASAKLILPDLSIKELPMNLNTVMLPKPPMGGYYALVITQKNDHQANSAVRYLSLHGRPVKISPTQLTQLPKSDLEIIPDPLHREHDRYTASKTYRFIVMFQGKPLPEKSVVLETLNQTTLTYTSDTQGVVTVDLPDDFKNVTLGRGENKPSEFLLTASHTVGGMTFASTFSMPYHVNPNDYWQSQSYGAGAILIGFLGGLFLYRRSKGVRNG